MDSCDHVTGIHPSDKHSILRPQKWLCSVCGTTESVYACLSCSHVACGRFNEQHSLQHYKESKHPIAIEVNNKHVYCYECDDYVLNDNPAGEIQRLRTALSAIATQSFQEIEPKARPLLRSFSIHEECSEANKFEDKIQTAEACRRTFLLRKAFHGWRKFIDEKCSLTPGKKRRLSDLVEDVASSTTSVRRPAIIPGVTGLRNLGNTCYMNSILQVLSHLQTFRTFFLDLVPELGMSPWKSVTRTTAPSVVGMSGLNLTRKSTVELFHHLSKPEDRDHKAKDTKGGKQVKGAKRGQGPKAGLPGGSTGGQGSKADGDMDGPDSVFLSLCLELHALFRVLWSGKWAQVSPHAFLHAVWNVMPAFKGYSQQDAQEFLCELLDKVQEELQGTSCSSNSSLVNKTDIVSSVFQGEVVSQVTCLKCGHRSRTVEPFTDLSLEFPDRYQVKGANWAKPQGPCYLTEMLAKFTEEELLDGQIYACEQCNGKRRKASNKPPTLTDAKKQILISKLPCVLRLHLKRFRWSGRNHREKICSHVNFENCLNLQSYCEESLADRNCVYRLSGVVIHHGWGFGCGHYTAYTWNHAAGSWVSCNDARMELCPLEKVAAAQAYILFYTQKGGGHSRSASMDTPPTKLLDKDTPPTQLLDEDTPPTQLLSDTSSLGSLYTLTPTTSSSPKQ